MEARALPSVMRPIGSQGPPGSSVRGVVQVLHPVQGPIWSQGLLWEWAPLLVPEPTVAPELPAVPVAAMVPSALGSPTVAPEQLGRVGDSAPPSVLRPIVAVERVDLPASVRAPGSPGPQTTIEVREAH